MSILYGVFSLILRQLWLSLLLRLPVLYFFRISRVFEEAELTGAQLASIDNYSTSNSFALSRVEAFQRSWNDLLDSLKAEWQAQGIVSTLLLPYVPVLP
jgi:hypothetical protein